MNKIFLLLAATISFAAYSQETRLVTKGRPIVKGRPGFHEEYSVLVSDKKIKHGGYTKLITTYRGLAFETVGNYHNGKKSGQWQMYYGTSNNIKEVGFYKNDLQDSTWEYYFPEERNYPIVKSGQSLKIENTNPILGIKGKFRKGKRVGVWEYYNLGSVLMLKFDYDTREVLYMKNEGPDNFKSGYLGDNFFLYDQLYSIFDFNDLLNSMDNQKAIKPGKLVFTFRIDERCNVIDILCQEKTIANKKIYERAISAVQSLDGHYYARKLEGKNIPDVKTVTFDFTVDVKSNYSISGQKVVVRGEMEIASLTEIRNRRVKISVE